ncbi:hypothetical protein C7S18_05055 [Ahniella affigens]|uniref:Peptidase M28 domain-containing protein n=1 Tax=Ahniella affigens TaxID=2021234 RepID=A0A2P1PP40_9GAMM|nr:M28 family metallopeptidase [Ahniella affigens]AVP96608.1 hypothetical protein C7S18_05055 [Ahniella affigens]
MTVRHRFWVVCLLVLAVSACQDDVPTARVASVAERAVEADVRFLADDLLEGRDTGSRGHEIASRYVAAQFQAMGLVPAGDDGTYFQRLDLLQAVRVREQSRFELVAPGNKKRRLKFQDDYLPGLTFEQAAIELTAPMVFVGQAVQAPELEYDDFAGVDVHGKIAVSFGNAPASFPGDERAYYASTLTKAETLVRLGAVGWIQLSDPADEERRPWARGAANWQQPSMRLVEPDGNVLDTFPELKVRASVSPAASALLFGEAERSWTDVLESHQRGENRAMDLNLRVTLASRQVLTRLSSHNVVARLPGSGPLADQHVALTSHLDHIGIGAEIAGDSLYNGAQDNAVGIAILLETARQAASLPTLRRSLVFVATTGEEKGLLGAHQFARHPTVGRVIANLNMDMPVLLVPTKDVTPIGLEHTSLASAVKQAAKEQGVVLSPDPAPDENTFVRSDQYAFIRRGIPSVYVDGGYVAVDPKHDAKALQQEFLRTHYHQPSDDLRLPVVWSDAARMARLNARIVELVANNPVNPRWKDGDFFGRRFGGGR